MMAPRTDKILRSLTQRCHGGGGGDKQEAEEEERGFGIHPMIAVWEFRGGFDNTVPPSDICLPQLVFLIQPAQRRLKAASVMLRSSLNPIKPEKMNQLFKKM